MAGFTVPNLQTAGFAGQTYWDATDIAILVAGTNEIGVLTDTSGTFSGGAVTWTSGMGLSVTAGTGLSFGTKVTWSAATPTVTASSTTDRRDLVVVSTAGAVSVVAGTALSGGFVAVKPALTAGYIALAEVYVPASVGALTAAMLTDKRVGISANPDPTGILTWMSI